MGKLCQLSPELWPLIDVIILSYIELIFSWQGIMLACSTFIAYAKTRPRAAALSPHN